MNPPYSPAVPALRWSADGGFDLEAPWVETAVAEGCAGFILFGGTADGAREATEKLAQRARRPLLFGADLERGAGQQFSGAVPLPPAAALAALEDLDVLRTAGALTAREAVALGVPWIFAPVADLALEDENPILGTRALGRDPERVAQMVEAWILGCVSQGGIPCVKHFPGHGRTLEDSHAALPTVDASRAALNTHDLVPFRRAVEAGVPTVMTAHVAYPALDAAGRPATRSAPIVSDLLRGELNFGGVVVTDALIMEGAGEPTDAVVEAMGAGADLLLYPPPGVSVRDSVAEALSRGKLTPAGLQASRRRVQALCRRIPEARAGDGWGRAEDWELARDWARRSLTLLGDMGPLEGPVDLTVVDDDLGGPWPPPSREPLAHGLRARGIRISSEGSLKVLCVFAETRAWKGRAGLSREAGHSVARWAEGARQTGGGQRGLVLVFGGPRVAAGLPDDLPRLVAWGGEALMQEAAAQWLADRMEAGGS
jgi:beta-glucosidase